MDSPPGQISPHILILDDDATHRELCLRAFRDDAGTFRVSVAASVQKAREIIESDPPDLIIADWVLPEGKGLDILPRTDGNVTIPLIIMTSYGDEHLAVEIMKSGAIDYIVKSATTFRDLPHIARHALRDWVNINERKRAEAEVHESQKRLLDILAFLPDATFAIDQDGRVIAWNRAIEEMTSVSSAEMVGKGDHEYSIPFYGNRRPILIDLVLMDDAEIEKKYDYIQRDDGRLTTEVFIPTLFGGKGAYLWGTASALYDPAGNRVGAIEVIRDITERKRMEDALADEMAKRKILIDQSGEGIVTLDSNGKVFEANKRFADMLRYTSDEIRELHVWDWDTLFGREKLLEMIRTIDEAGDHFETRHRRKDGTSFDVEISTNAAIFSGEKLIFCVVRDITERKQAEAALIESETRFRALIQNSSDIIRILNRDGQIVYESPSAEKILGYAPGYMIGKDPFDNIHPEDLGQVKIDLQDVYDRTNAGTPTEFRIRKSDGEYIWVDSIGTNLLDVPGVNGIVVTTRPIQRRKQAEEAINETLRQLERSEALLRDVYEILPIGLWLADKNGKLQYGNPAGVRIWGAEPRVPVEQYGVFKARRFPSGEEVAPDDWALAHTIREGVTVKDEMLEIEAFDGKKKIILNYTAPLFDAAGAIDGAIVVNQEITDKVKAEQALRENQARLATAMDIAGLVNWEFDVATGMFTFDDRFYALYGTTADHEGGHLMPAETYMREFVHPDDRKAVLAEIQKMLATTDPYFSSQMEHRITPRDGSVRTIIVRQAPIVGPDGKVIRTYGANQDITDRILMESEIRSLNTVLEQRVKDRTEALQKSNEALEEENVQRLEAEAKLQASYDEKVLLLKEIHHRVKNNLQIIASLLNLQSRYISDKQTLAAIRESQNRVKAMALVHEKLYRSEDIAHISLHDYIRFLGTGLFQFYDAKVRGIQLSLDIHDVNVDIDAAIPLGLIVNELISNSLKYAFPDDRKGEIAISVKKEGHTMTVVFRDTGIGIPADLDWKNTQSLGLRLVNTLVDQMNGTVELDRSSGTQFTMVVHEKEPEGRNQ
jgi:PAS domain S-box-containing protein